jgi:pimeloyl-ACP methyl ester carboxylesterase
MSGFETMRAELAAMLASVAALPLAGIVARDSPGADTVHPTPVIFVHGLFGYPSNFWALRRFLAARGVRRFASVSYGPRIDFQTLAPMLRARIESVCARAGVEEVDVVGHSLGGLIARHLLEHERGARIRRLVTLGSPWYGRHFPSRELALFAAQDWLIPAPDPGRSSGGRVVVLPACSHMSLLHHAQGFGLAAAHLTAAPPAVDGRAHLAASHARCRRDLLRHAVRSRRGVSSIVRPGATRPGTSGRSAG